jgi:hypothetical protein
VVIDDKGERNKDISDRGRSNQVIGGEVITKGEKYDKIRESIKI